VNSSLSLNDLQITSATLTSTGAGAEALGCAELEHPAFKPARVAKPIDIISRGNTVATFLLFRGSFVSTYMGLSEVISCVFPFELRRLASDSCRTAYDSRPDIVLDKIDEDGAGMVT
jgi:hypothetical protein